MSFEIYVIAWLNLYMVKKAREYIHLTKLYGNTNLDSYMLLRNCTVLSQNIL